MTTSRAFVAHADRGKMIEILRTPVDAAHVAGPRTSADWLTPQSVAGGVREIAPNLGTLEPRELLDVARDADCARALVTRWALPFRHDDVEIRRYRRDAAVLLSRYITPNLTPGVPLTPDQFFFQTNLLSTIEVHPTTYRFDARPPGDIAVVGFSPNPARAPTTIWEGCQIPVLGGSNAVSLTSEADHPPAARGLPKAGQEFNDFLEGRDPKIVEVITRVLAQVHEADPGVDTRELESVLWARLTDHYLLADQKALGQLRVRLRRGHQYEISSSEGARIPDGFGQDVEREIVARVVTPDRVRHAGAVVYLGVYIWGKVTGLDPRPSWDLLEFVLGEDGRVSTALIHYG